MKNEVLLQTEFPDNYKGNNGKPLAVYLAALQESNIPLNSGDQVGTAAWYVPDSSGNIRREFDQTLYYVDGQILAMSARRQRS